jgi:hypothetical protein
MNGNDTNAKGTTMKLNGNRFVKVPHLFVEGKGTFFPTQQIAVDHGTSPNGTGLWVKTVEFNGQTWFQAGNTNVWN